LLAKVVSVVTLTTGVPFAAMLAFPGAQRAITWIVALLLIGFSVLAGFTIGLFFLPSGLLLLLAAILTLFIRNERPDVSRIERSAW
jgi:hypothetical protein